MQLQDENCRHGIAKVDDTETAALLKQVPAWRIDDGKLFREFHFPDFVSAFTFVGQIKDIAEDQNHHPEIYLTWGVVKVWWTTHDAGGLSRNDFVLAAKLDHL